MKFKLIFVGSLSQKVGIHSFIKRYIDGVYHQDGGSDDGLKKVIGSVDLITKEMVDQDSSSADQLLIFMPFRSSEARFIIFPSAYLKAVDGIFLFFDVTNKASFKKCKELYGDMKKEYGVITQDNNEKGPIIVALIGCKCDIEQDKRQVSIDEAIQWTKDNKLAFYQETSAKDNIGIDNAFNTIYYSMLMNIN
ncbi:hypothetical protein DFA_03192 [Cavenderia fasciculata]|uniref:Uncharacterized protein n=1 Tax=Cavenderia fasciculata TaxID=261658 RepID=F4PGW3_CACFS|nr:uncharacterized protein DFA_03192 [Cavenderia fasciculata]EGG24947.1 hypothetical protein DFA_03192 [Cavenderia fasciculata]|eukprot:XP_004362798.1 hypothetical protein DFA_03192 [Cavenderia fasciculata]